MKASELIEKLEALKDQYGNLEVFFEREVYFESLPARHDIDKLAINRDDSAFILS